MSYPEDKADEMWRENGLLFSLVKTDMGHWCGYVRFKERPVNELEYNGILTYAPVHGGITYANEDADGMVYGFDCAHAGDDQNPVFQNIDWLKNECDNMAVAIQEAAQFEDRYLLADTDEEKARVINEYHDRLRDKGIVFDLQDNFGAMINVLFGSL